MTSKLPKALAHIGNFDRRHNHLSRCNCAASCAAKPRKPCRRPPSHHLVSQRGFATKEALDILVENIDDVFLVTPGFARRVRGDQQVRESPEGGFARQRLLVEAVECRSAERVRRLAPPEAPL